MEFEPVIGLEIHVQLKTKSKMFCSCSTEFNAPPNSNVCPVCLGLPGALPVVNKEAVLMGIKAAIALGCKINLTSIFARKNYFYPDLPKGYQISQFDKPLAENGEVEVLTGERNKDGNIIYNKFKKFRITRIHLEEDSGKSIHDKGDSTLLNFNRSGVPLIEIVSEPDFRSSQEAYDYLVHLKRTLQYIGVSDCNMEEGSLRCDANVSVRPKGEEKFGTKTEIKNLNSFRFLQKALDYEIKRQIEVIESGGKVVQETRLYDSSRDMTFVMRSKEEAHDYRYFPEPDLLPLVVEKEWIEKSRRELVELPHQKQKRFIEEYKLNFNEALFLTDTVKVADFFEECVKLSGDSKGCANWIMGDFTALLKKEKVEIDKSKITPNHISKLLKLIKSGSISGKIAKTVFEEMFKSGEDPEKIVKEKGLSQITNEEELLPIIKKVIEENPKQVAAYKGGKEKLIGFFVGQVMKETKGRANPQLLNDLLKKELKK